MSTNSVAHFPRYSTRGNASQVEREAVDGWQGLSKDLIERFLDVICFERGLTRTARRGYRADLAGLDSWMHKTLGRTLVTASGADLRAYFQDRIDSGLEQRLLDRLVSSMRDFYRYASDSGCRDDNPAQRLSSSFSKATRSLFAFAAPLLFRAN